MESCGFFWFVRTCEPCFVSVQTTRFLSSDSKMKIIILSVLMLGSHVCASVIDRLATTPCAVVGIAAKAYKVNSPGCTYLHSPECFGGRERVRARKFADSSHTATPHVDAQLAYDCLISAPLDPGAATALIESILPYVEWQSSSLYLKSPPPGYQFPGVDIFASLHTILDNIKNGVYGNEHAFQTDLLILFQSVHDGHFRFSPDLLSRALVFRRPMQVVSVSRDGVEVPKVYLRGQ